MSLNNNIVVQEVAVLENFMNDQTLQSSTNIHELRHVINSADRIIKAFRNDQVWHRWCADVAFKVKAKILENLLGLNNIIKDTSSPIYNTVNTVASIEMLDNFLGLSNVIRNTSSSLYNTVNTAAGIERDIHIIQWFFRARQYWYEHEFLGIKNEEEAKRLLESADNVYNAYKKFWLMSIDTEWVRLAIKARAYIFENYTFRKHTVGNSIRWKTVKEYVAHTYTIPEWTITEHAKSIFEENHNVCQTKTATYYHEIDKILPLLSDSFITHPTRYYDMHNDIHNIECMIANTYSEAAKENITKKITVAIYNEFDISNKAREYHMIDNSLILTSYQRKNILYRCDEQQRKNIVHTILYTPSLTMAADEAYSGYQGASYWEEYAFYPQGRKVPKCKSLDEYDMDWRNTRGNGVRFIEDWRQY